MRGWVDLHLVPVWVDEEGNLSSAEPPPPEYDRLYLYADKREVARVVFGALISDGGMKI